VVAVPCAHLQLVQQDDASVQLDARRQPAAPFCQVQDNARAVQGSSFLQKCALKRVALRPTMRKCGTQPTVA